MTEAYGHGHKAQYIVSPCRIAARSRSAPNVSLTSPLKTAIECFMGRLGKLIPSHGRRLATNHTPQEPSYLQPLDYTPQGTPRPSSTPLTPIPRVFLQMPQHNTLAIDRSYQGMVDAIHYTTPSLSPQPHAPTDFTPCTTRFNCFNASAGRYLARPNPVPGMHILFLLHLQC